MMTLEERRAMAASDPVGFSGRHWPQTREEVEAFVALLVAEGVTSYLEIGCRYGDTFQIEPPANVRDTAGSEGSADA